MKKLIQILSIVYSLVILFSVPIGADDSVLFAHTRMRSAGPLLNKGDTFILLPDGSLAVPNRFSYPSPQINYYSLLTTEIQVDGRTLHFPYRCRPIEFRIEKLDFQSRQGSSVLTDHYAARYVRAIGDLPVYTEAMTDEDYVQECMKGADFQAKGSVVPAQSNQAKAPKGSMANPAGQPRK